MKRIFRILTLVSLVSMLACNEAKRDNNENEDNDEEKDADFVANTVAANYGEIKFAQLANQRSADPELKKIATMLVTEHTKTLDELKSLAQAKAITVPVEEDDEARRKTERFS